MIPEDLSIKNKSVVEFKDRIEKYVSDLLLDYKPAKVRNRKVLHEAIHGSCIFYEHEITILDSPLLQRLRRIHQNGLAYLTYPTSVHSRFDHTIGVVSVLSDYVDAINTNLDSEQIKDLFISKDPYNGDYANLRMAALLHDCGHSFFSHTSEKLYENDSIFKNLIKIDNSDLKYRQAHEILSHYIVKSETFQGWFKENIKDVNIDLDIVADMIIGISKNPKKKYLSEMINGHLDADKLDYIKRDSLFSGIKLLCDTARLFKTVKIRPDLAEVKNHIVLESFIPIEQIVTSRRSLITSVYHHQKVRACDSMVNSIIEYLNGTSIDTIKLEHPVDYLYYDDDKFMKVLEQVDDSFINSMHNSIINRKLYKRAFCVCQSTVEEWDSEHYNFNKLTHDEKYRKTIQEAIWDNISIKIKKKYGLIKLNIQLSFPEIGKHTKNETIHCYIINKVNNKLIQLNSYMPEAEWMNIYFNHKYRGYVFCPCDSEELRERIFYASKKAFREISNINILDDYCKNEIHLDSY